MTAAPTPTPTPAPVPATPLHGRLERRTRLAVAGLLALAIPNAAFLYGMPGYADTAYAWSIKPAASAAFLGGGYLAGVLATILTVFVARRWRSIQPMAFALFTLSAGLMAATLLHTDRFRWDYPLTWEWVAIYATVPFGVVWLTLRQRARTIRPVLSDPRLNVLRAASGVCGAVLAVYAIILFARSTALGDDWPWPLTPLLAQCVATWIGLFATMLLWCAYDLRRTSEALIPYMTLGAWCIALMLVPALHHADVTRSGAPLLIYLGALAVLLALAAHGVAVARRSLRPMREGSPPGGVLDHI